MKQKIAEFVATNSLSLPTSYLEFLEYHRSCYEYYFINGWTSPDEESSRPWVLAAFEESGQRYNFNIDSDFSIDRLQPVPYFKALSLYVQTLKDFFDDLCTVDQSGRKYPLERLTKSFCIGEENGDYLYLDMNDKSSVWVFHHDGGDVEKVADNFDQFLKNSTSDEKPST